MTVHHIHVDQVGATLLDRADFVTQLGEVRSQNGRRDLDSSVAHGSFVDSSSAGNLVPNPTVPALPGARSRYSRRPAALARVLVRLRCRVIVLSPTRARPSKLSGR